MSLRKVIIVASGLMAIPIVTIGIFGTYDLCQNNEKCIDLLHGFFLLFLPVAPLFLLSLLLFRVSDQSYSHWFKFARVWIPLTMLCVFLAPEYAHDLMLPIEKGTVALGMSAVFLVVSLGIVSWQYIRRVDRAN